MNDYSDEVSLRDLYLIFRRGFPLIAVVALVAGAAAFLYATLQPDRYEAQATVLVTATPERQADGPGTSIIRRTNVGYGTYESIAFSRRVLDATAQKAGVTVDDIDSVKEMLELENLIEGAQGDSQLIVGHTARVGSPADAARLANVWMEETIATVNATMRSILDPIIENNALNVAGLKADLGVAEEEWQAFQDRNEASLLEAELSSFTSRNAQAGERLDTLERDLKAGLAQQEALADALAELDDTAGSTVDADAGAVTALLESRELLAAEAAQELRAFMRDERTDMQLVRLLLGLELQSLVGSQASLEAQRAATLEQQAEYSEAAAARRSALAHLEKERSELDRRLRIAESLYLSALELEPVLSYISEVLESNVRVLDEAAEPLLPAARGRLLVTLIAFVVGGMLATVFVFLRAAVSEPPASRPAGVSGA